MKKVNAGGAAATSTSDILDELEDASILSKSMTVSPLIVMPDGSIEDSTPIPEAELAQQRAEEEARVDESESEQPVITQSNSKTTA